MSARVKRSNSPISQPLNVLAEAGSRLFEHWSVCCKQSNSFGSRLMCSTGGSVSEDARILQKIFIARVGSWRLSHITELEKVRSPANTQSLERLAKVTWLRLVELLTRRVSLSSSLVPSRSTTSLRSI